MAGGPKKGLQSQKEKKVQGKDAQKESAAPKEKAAKKVTIKRMAPAKEITGPDANREYIDMNNLLKQATEARNARQVKAAVANAKLTDSDGITTYSGTHLSALQKDKQLASVWNKKQDERNRSRKA